MAQIDLKNVVIKIKDGYNGPGGTPSVDHVLADPVAAPTATATGGGATGGSLAAGTYLISYTYITVDGETLRSPDSAGLVVSATNIPRVTLPALPTGCTGINLYVSTVGGNRASETKYNVGAIVTITYDMTTAAPTGATPPAVSTAGLLYAAGTGTMIVKGYTGAVITGDFFTVAGDPASGSLTHHRITAHSETLGNTTSVTFTPLLGASVDNNATITILPHELQVKIGEGNLTYSEKRKIKYVTDRGLLDTARLDNQEPVDVKFDFVWEYLRAASGTDPATPEECFKQTGNASSWVSSATDPCEPYAVDIELTNTPPCSGVKTEIISLPDFRWEDLAHDPKTAQISVTGKCNVVAALVSRV